MRIALHKFRPFFLSVVAAPIVTACVLLGCAPPYGPSSLEGGYKDVELHPGVFYVDYRGIPSLDRETVVEYWRRRAAELCPAGYEILADGDASPARPDVSKTAGIACARGQVCCK